VTVDRKRVGVTVCAVAVASVIVLWILDAFEITGIPLLAMLWFPVLLLMVVQVRPLLHWTLLVSILVSAVTVAIAVDRSNSSTASLGLISLLFSQTVAVLTVAGIERLLKERRTR